MPRPPIPTWYFALVVVRLGGRFLLVLEDTHEWYFPAGRVEPGEPILEAARRETLEEAGIPVLLEGIFRIEHRIHQDGSARLRFVFVARPADDSPPKSIADSESLGASWFTLEEIRQLPLRGPNVLEVLEAIDRGAPFHPLSLLQPELP